MNGHLLRGFLAVVMFSLGLSSSVRAQSAYIFIGESAFANTCTLGPGLHFLNVSILSVGPVAKARFKVVASAPVTWLSTPDPEFDVTSNPCGAYASALGPIIVIVPSGSSARLTAVPATGHSEIELTDCDGYDLHAVSNCGIAQRLAPYRPNPPDGATNVSTNQFLSYVGDANEVRISTSPDMSGAQTICFAGEYSCSLPLNPGPLAPHTSYYWQARSFCICGQVIPGNSEVFSFTTGDEPLAVEPSTWGRVKAMYRK